MTFTDAETATGSNINEVNRSPNTIFLSFRCSTPEENLKFMTLNNTKYAGYNEISTLLNILCYVNYFKLPLQLKFTAITPIYKTKEKEIISNYRPIALIPIPSKIFEIALRNRLISFIDKYKMLNADQHGFQKGKSITITAFQLVNNITEYLNIGLLTTRIFFDIS